MSPTRLNIKNQLFTDDFSDLCLVKKKLIFFFPFWFCKVYSFVGPHKGWKRMVILIWQYKTCSGQFRQTSILLNICVFDDPECCQSALFQISFLHSVYIRFCVPLAFFILFFTLFIYFLCASCIFYFIFSFCLYTFLCASCIFRFFHSVYGYFCVPLAFCNVFPAVGMSDAFLSKVLHTGL